MKKPLKIEVNVFPSRIQFAHPKYATISFYQNQYDAAQNKSTDFLYRISFKDFCDYIVTDEIMQYNIVIAGHNAIRSLCFDYFMFLLANGFIEGNVLRKTS